MSATFVPSHWPVASTASPTFGRRLLVAGAATGSAMNPAVQWLTQRNCSITPRQLGAVYLSLCSLSLLIAGFFYWQGAPYVAAFAGLELAALGLALLVFARHAGDRETITLMGTSLRVEQWVASRLLHTQLSTDWLAVEPLAGQGSLVQLRGRGRSVCVGRFVRPELRGAFAQEIRQALRQAASPAPARQEPENDAN